MKLEHAMQLTAEYARGRLLAGTIGDVGVLLFNQPDKRNAISQEMWEGLRTAADRFAADPAIQVVMVAGAGGQAFTSGNDISQFAERRSSAEANVAFMRTMASGRAGLSTMSKPTIACIQGFCLGGGLATALLADFRVADQSAVFGIPAARLGIAYGIDETQDLVTAVGPSRARLMLYTARRFNATEAHAMGLVDVLADDAASEALALAQTVAGNAPLSVQAAKFSVAQAREMPERRDAATLMQNARRCIDSADYREGREAFMAKRKPTFKGS